MIGKTGYENSETTWWYDMKYGMFRLKECFSRVGTRILPTVGFSGQGDFMYAGKGGMVLRLLVAIYTIFLAYQLSLLFNKTSKQDS